MTIWAKFAFGSTGLSPIQKRGAPLADIARVSNSTSGSPTQKKLSAFFAAASVTPMAPPSGNRIWKNNSRYVSRSGRIAAAPGRRPRDEPTNISTVAATLTVLRLRRQNSINFAERSVKPRVVDRLQDRAAGAGASREVEACRPEIRREEHRHEHDAMRARPDDEDAAGIIHRCWSIRQTRQAGNLLRSPAFRLGIGKAVDVRRANVGAAAGAAEAQLDLHDHHFDSNDGVIDQQSAAQ